MRLVCKTTFGSRLYGTATPTSDVDVRGIFMPDVKDILLGRIPRTNKDNAGNDEDFELYSLHHFVKLACEGQTVAFDMLWTPPSMVVAGPAGEIWEELVNNRHKFISKRMNAFIGYARGQAAKYSLKGARLARLTAFLDVLKNANDDVALGYYLADASRPFAYDDNRINQQGIQEIQICGKWFGVTTQVKYVRQSCEHALASYGERAHAAANDGGIDWKALSHAVRVSIELRDLLAIGDITFPLPEAKMLLEIKTGHYNLDYVQSLLDTLLFDVERLSKESSLPENVDRAFWDDWLADKTESYIRYPEGAACENDE